MKAEPDKTGKVILLCIGPRKVPELRVRELAMLARAAKYEICEILHVRCVTPHAKYYVGAGKAESVKQLLSARGAATIVTSCDFSPGQERNLGLLCEARVVGYTGLILEVFSRRARSYEGKLQVELAGMQYEATRLVSGWSHLERQKGGIGLRGGPGEKQLETDRRLLRKRIARVRAQLEKVKKSRHLSASNRSKNAVFSVVLVGYTNTGKSTVFRHLTGTDVLCANMPFATLDPTIRRLRDRRIKAVVSDTVGFITDLPHTLVSAFNATLSEVRNADLLMHVTDLSHSNLSGQIAEVNSVLRELGADGIPRIIVYNKADMAKTPVSVRRDTDGRIIEAVVSALSGDGMPLLERAIAEYARDRAAITADDSERKRLPDERMFNPECNLLQ